MTKLQNIENELGTIYIGSLFISCKNDKNMNSIYSLSHKNAFLDIYVSVEMDNPMSAKVTKVVLSIGNGYSAVHNTMTKLKISPAEEFFFFIFAFFNKTLQQSIT